jgi:caffeoyl-CoA O-methyltransferase
MNKELEKYCDQHSSKELSLLQELTRQTFVNVLNPRMLSGHSQGLFLQMIVAMIHPKRVLEIGTYTGYSALCLAKNLEENSLLHTIEINDEVAAFAHNFFGKSEFSTKIQSHVGDAVEIIAQLDEMFQLVFMDGNKRDYVKYYNCIFDKVASGGFIIADNVLWDGHVLDEEKKINDAQTKGISEFNEMIRNDERVEKLMLPLRDGLLVIRKI